MKNQKYHKMYILHIRTNLRNSVTRQDTGSLSLEKENVKIKFSRTKKYIHLESY